MKIKPEQTDRLADRLLKSYRAKDLVVLKADETVVKTKIKTIIAQNFLAEEALEQEARKMLDSHVKDIKEMDQHRMFQLLKQKLAQKKGFVL